MAYIRVGSVFTDEAEQRRTAFQADLAALSAGELFDKHISLPDSCVLTQKGRGAIFNEFNRHWGIPVDSLMLVGSAALGFSIKPKRRYQLFDFNDSDIDVAVIDSGFFVDLWQEVRVFLEENASWPDQGRFEEYLLQGWIRPDLLPSTMYNEWFDFFSDVRKTGKSGGIKVRAAIYPSAYFLKSYQSIGIANCQLEPL